MEQKTALRKATPVARKWANKELKAGKAFNDIEAEYLVIKSVECKLYGEMKATLVEHIRRHGLDALALKFFEDFKAIGNFDKNCYNALLKKIRRAYAQSDGNRSLEYLLAKIAEYLRKVSDLNKTAWRMLENGQKPDLQSWSDKVSLQDNLYEENKQFLKQVLHHLEILEKNKVKMGVPEIRLLLYNMEGCRREKLYCRTEEWIIRLFYNLTSETEQQSVYADICRFLEALVPEVGYISPMMISFIFSNGFISEQTKILLSRLKPVIKKLSMAPIVTSQLEVAYKQAKKHLRTSHLTETDRYVYELLKLYEPSLIPQEDEIAWQQTLNM